MRRKEETRLQRWKRWWSFYGRDQVEDQAVPALLGLLLFGLLLALHIAVDRVGRGFFGMTERSSLWQWIPPASQYFLIGVSLEGLAVLLIRKRIRKRKQVRTLLDLRIFLGEMSFALVGGWCLLKAAGLR